MIASPLQGLIEPSVHDPWFDDRIAVANVDFEDSLHPREDQHHAAADRQRAAGQTGAGPAGHDRHSAPPGRLKDASHLVGIAREHSHVGRVLFDLVAVAFVDQQIGPGGQNAIGADNLAQFVDQCSKRGGTHGKWGRPGDDVPNRRL